MNPDQVVVALLLSHVEDLVVYLPARNHFYESSPPPSAPPV